MHFFTSLKWSNALRMIWWPPWTRQTAARSSNTSAFVLRLLCLKLRAIALIESCLRITIFSPCFVFIIARKQRMQTWMSSFASPMLSLARCFEVRLLTFGLPMGFNTLLPLLILLDVPLGKEGASYWFVDPDCLLGEVFSRSGDDAADFCSCLHLKKMTLFTIHTAYWVII